MFGISETCYRYERRLSEENKEIAAWAALLDAEAQAVGVCSVFFSFAQCAGFWLEPQARVSDLQAGVPAFACEAALTA